MDEIARAEVVDLQSDAKLAQIPQDLLFAGSPGHQDGLGDLQDQAAGVRCRGRRGCP